MDAKYNNQATAQISSAGGKKAGQTTHKDSGLNSPTIRTHWLFGQTPTNHLIRSHTQRITNAHTYPQTHFHLFTCLPHHFPNEQRRLFSLCSRVPRHRRLLDAPPPIRLPPARYGPAMPPRLLGAMPPTPPPALDAEPMLKLPKLKPTPFKLDDDVPNSELLTPLIPRPVSSAPKAPPNPPPTPTPPTRRPAGGSKAARSATKAVRCCCRSCASSKYLRGRGGGGEEAARCFASREERERERQYDNDRDSVQR